MTGLTSSTNVIPSASQTATYTSFEKVSTLIEGVYSAAFIYNDDQQRAKMDITQSGSTILTRWYAGSSYMKETAAGVTKEYTYLGGDAYSAPVVAVTQSGTTNYFYLLRDYLGNITHQVNTSNTVVAEYSFDAWGRRRNPTDWSYTLTGQPELFADRGFTSHEFLKYFNIYNMNGRLYDPLVGRFLNPDNVIQDPTSTQNYNRYSYCLNNPLKYTDPSGNTYKEYMDNLYGEGNYWYRGQAPGTWGGEGSNSSGGSNGHWEPIQTTKTVKVSVGVDDYWSQKPTYMKRIYKWEWVSDGDGIKYTLGNFSDGLNAAGIAAGGAEIFTEANAGARITYTTIKGISASVSSAKVLGILSSVGTFTLVGTVFIDLSLGFTGYQTPWETIANIGVGTAAWKIAGVPGFVIGVGYTVLDKTGMFDRPTGPMPHYTPPSIAMPDATRVAPPIIKY